jgi:hypothetical protein
MATQGPKDKVISPGPATFQPLHFTAVLISQSLQAQLLSRTFLCISACLSVSHRRPSCLHKLVGVAARESGQFQSLSDTIRNYQVSLLPEFKELLCRTACFISEKIATLWCACACACVCALGTICRSSVLAVNVFTHGALSLAPKRGLLKI